MGVLLPAAWPARSAGQDSARGRLFESRCSRKVCRTLHSCRVCAPGDFLPGIFATFRDSGTIEIPEAGPHLRKGLRGDPHPGSLTTGPEDGQPCGPEDEGPRAWRAVAFSPGYRGSRRRSCWVSTLGRVAPPRWPAVPIRLGNSPWRCQRRLSASGMGRWLSRRSSSTAALNSQHSIL